MVQDHLRQDTRVQGLYFNISEIKLSIKSLYIISNAPNYNIIRTENRDVIDSFISEYWNKNPGSLWPGVKGPRPWAYTE